MKRSIAVLISVILFVGMLVLGVISKMHAQDTQGQQACSDATFQGTYAVRSTGFHQIAPPTTTQSATNPDAAVGVITANGAGGVSGTIVLSINGAISPPTPATGNYTVFADCTGSITIGGTTEFLGITPNGARAFFINENPGSVETVEAVR